MSQQAARQAIDAKTKPLGALGYLEEIAVRLSILQGTLKPSVDPVRICVFAADHGVTAEGVSAYPSAVTGEMMKNFAGGGAAINVIARASGAQVEVIDVGVAADLTALAGIRHAKVRAGTRNFAVEPAMTNDELNAALAAGAYAANCAAGDGVRAIGLGEMGIGNTTSAAAVLSGLTGQPASLTAGRGTGVTDEVMARKREVIGRAIRTHKLLERRDARETLRCVGGLEIAAIAGAALAAAQRRLVVIADGFISTTAIACAAAMAQTSGAASSLRDALFVAHRSAEQGHELAIATCSALLHTDERPLLDLGLRLGEGSGAALATPILRAAAAVMREMATFGSAGISAGEHAGAHRDVSGQ